MDGLQHGDEYPWIIKGVSYNGNLKWVAMNAATGEESPEFGHYKMAQEWIRAERPGTLLRKSGLDFTGDKA